MSLLTLAALQSPFSPAYALIGLLWATTLLAVEVRGVFGTVALAAIWVFLLVIPPGVSLEVRALHSLAETAITIGVCGWLVLRAPIHTEARA